MDKGAWWTTVHRVAKSRVSCRDQEGRRGSEEAVPGPPVFPSGDPGVSGDFWAHETPPSSRDEGLLFLHGLERNPESLELRRQCGVSHEI